MKDMEVNNDFTFPNSDIFCDGKELNSSQKFTYDLIPIIFIRIGWILQLFKESLQV